MIGPIRTAAEASLVARALASVVAPTPAQAIKALDAPKIHDGTAARVKGREFYEALAKEPNLVCIERYGRKIVATYGPEPRDSKEFWRLRRAKRLDRGGKGFVLVDVYGEVSVTHNLSAEKLVPVEFDHLFTATHLRVSGMSDAEESRHWGFDPWADLREAA